ncbi:MAG: hypothetical protein ACTSPA_03950 [Promethearchaeota archaeon]
MNSEIEKKEKVEKVKARFKNYHSGIWFLMLFLIPLIIFFYLSRYVEYGSFQIGTYVNYSNETQFFTVSWNYLLQIVFLGPIFGIIFYILMKKLLSKIDINARKNQLIVYIIDICVVALIILNCIGHFSHLGFEIVNTIDSTMGETLNSEYKELFVYAWFMDEWFGHTLIHVTYFGYLIVAMCAELLLNEDKRMMIDELLLILLFSLVYSVIDGYAAIEGECGFILLILHLIATFVSIAFITVKRINPLKYPLLLTLLISTFFVILFNLDWIIRYGINSAYPFYSGNLS